MVRRQTEASPGAPAGTSLARNGKREWEMRMGMGVRSPASAVRGQLRPLLRARDLVQRKWETGTGNYVAKYKKKREIAKYSNPSKKISGKSNKFQSLQIHDRT